MTERDLKVYFLPEEKLDVLNELLKDVINFLNKNKIQYWATFGTLLGAVRHKGQIPWDDDVDLGIMERDIRKLIKKCVKFKKKYKITISATMMKFILPNQAYKSKYRVIGNPCVDIFYYKKVNNKIILYDKTFREDKFPKAYYLKNELFPSRRIPFNDFMISVPYDPEYFLDRTYRNWDKFFVVVIRTPDGNKDTKMNFDFHGKFIE